MEIFWKSSFFYTQMMYKALSQEVAQEYSFEMNAYNSSNDFEIVLRIATFRHDAETLDEDTVCLSIDQIAELFRSEERRVGKRV